MQDEDQRLILGRLLDREWQVCVVPAHWAETVVQVLNSRAREWAGGRKKKSRRARASMHLWTIDCQGDLGAVYRHEAAPEGCRAGGPTDSLREAAEAQQRTASSSG